MSPQEIIRVQAHLAALDYMVANLYVNFCEKRGVDAAMIKSQNDDLRKKLTTVPPGFDPAEFALIAPYFADPVQAILVQIEAMAGALPKTATPSGLGGIKRR